MIKLNCSAKEVWLSIHIKSKEKVNRFHGGTGLPKLATSHFCYCAAGMYTCNFAGPEQFVWIQMPYLSQSNHTVKREMIFSFFRIPGLSTAT